MFAVIAVGVWETGNEARRSEPGSVERWHRLLLLAWAGVPLAAALLISAAVSLLQAGYLIAAIPAFAMLAALGITRIAELVATGLARLSGRAGSGASDGATRRGHRGLALVAVMGVAFVVVPFARSFDAYGSVVENGPRETAYVIGLTRPGDGIIFDQPSQRMIFDYDLLARSKQAGTFPVLPSPIWPSAPWGTQLPYAADHRLPGPASIASLGTRFERIWVVDGGWAPLPRYLAESHAMLLALSKEYRVAGVADFKGVKVLLFARSGPLPPGMHAWTGQE
jgi:hypothetical protein